MSAVPSLEPFSKEDLARRRKRAIVLALVLAAFVALFYITTIVRLGSGVAERTL